jgi:hypothetical protein
MGINDNCLKNPSLECDRWVQDYCMKHPNDIDFCGCSINALKQIPDPALGNLPVKCWANSCNKNPNAYQFYFIKDQKCPDVCVDNSTLTALGSNIQGSQLTQSSCNGQVNIQKDTSDIQKKLNEFYKYGIGIGILFIIIILCISISMSSILLIK